MPSLVSKAINAPVLLYAYGDKAVRSGGGAIRKGGGAIKRGGRAVAEAITGADSGVLDTFASAKSTLPPAPSALSAMEEAVPAEEQAAAAAAEQEEQAATAAGAAPHLEGNPSKQQVVPQMGGTSSATVVWLVWAFALYIAAVALLAVGTVREVGWARALLLVEQAGLQAGRLPAHLRWLQVELRRLPEEPRCGLTCGLSCAGPACAASWLPAGSICEQLSGSLGYRPAGR